MKYGVLRNTCPLFFKIYIFEMIIISPSPPFKEEWSNQSSSNESSFVKQVLFSQMTSNKKVLLEMVYRVTLKSWELKIEWFPRNHEWFKDGRALSDSNKQEVMHWRVAGCLIILSQFSCRNNVFFSLSNQYKSCELDKEWMRKQFHWACEILCIWWKK